MKKKKNKNNSHNNRRARIYTFLFINIVLVRRARGIIGSRNDRPRCTFKGNAISFETRIIIVVEFRIVSCRTSLITVVSSGNRIYGFVPARRRSFEYNLSAGRVRVCSLFRTKVRNNDVYIIIIIIIPWPRVTRSFYYAPPRWKSRET